MIIDYEIHTSHAAMEIKDSKGIITVLEYNCSVDGGQSLLELQVIGAWIGGRAMQRRGSTHLLAEFTVP